MSATEEKKGSLQLFRHTATGRMIDSHILETQDIAMGEELQELDFS